MDRFFSDRNFFQRIGIVLLLLAFLFAILKTQELVAQSLEEGAKKEGKVVFYCSMIVPDILKMADGFQKKYPFVKVEPYRANEVKILEKILMEKRAGKAFADIMHMAGIWTNLYKKEGLLGKYISPESKIYPQGFKDPEGFWTAYYTTYHTFIYNTRMVAKKDLPKTYEDLLDPKWKGKIGLSSDEFEWYMGMLDFLGEEKGRQFMKRLADQDPVIRTGRTLVATLLAAGEFPMALGVVHRTLEMQKEGAPVDMIPFPTPTLAAMRCIGIHTNAPHPNAAKLLGDFILSKDGQTILNRINRHPVRPDIQVEPVLEAIRRNLFPLGPRDPELMQSYKKEYEKTLSKR